jgi:hypothetical protein
MKGKEETRNERVLHYLLTQSVSVAQLAAITTMFVN